MPEITINLHMHTVLSDGSATHAEIAQAALHAGLDAVIITDHNVLPQGMEQVVEVDGRRVVVLVGQEIHDRARDPQKNHLLVFGASRELAPFAADPQRVIDQANLQGGLTFIAHPVDPPLPAFHQEDLSWESWDVRGYTGIELWNGFSEFKAVVKNKLQGARYALSPRWLAHGPLPETLRLWDSLLARGERVVAVGGSDAHALPVRLGPFRKAVFPYSYHFRSVNTHLMLPSGLTGRLEPDRALIYDALRAGHCFVGWDQEAPTRGFRFQARGKEETASMGDTIRLNGGVTLQVHLPQPAPCRLIHNGQEIRSFNRRDNIIHTATQPGAYRVEAYLPVGGKTRGWIFSNPIYVRG